jgi:predicted branched-subunit amino acid permease
MHSWQINLVLMSVDGRLDSGVNGGSGGTATRAEEPTTGRWGLTSPERSALTKQALSIGVSLIPFGLAFGVQCTQAKLQWFHALGMSSLVFTGGTQFAAVGVLKDGGTAAAAIAAGLLLSLRSLVYGLMMAPTLKGSLPFRMGASQLMIDESVAVSSAQQSPAARRAGYLAGGLSVFLFWNVSTMVGFWALGANADFTQRFGLDVTVPAAFAALVWPRLGDPLQRLVAIVGAVIAFGLIPIAPAGMPIVAAALAVPLVLAVKRSGARAGRTS